MAISFSSVFECVCVCVWGGGRERERERERESNSLCGNFYYISIHIPSCQRKQEW